VSLRGRLLAAFAYVLVLLSVALVVPFALNLTGRIDAEVRAEATSQAQLIAASASGRLSDRRELASLARRAARAASGRVIVVDRRGRLLADSAGGGLASASYANRPEIARALRGRPAQGQRRSDSLRQELLFTAVPVVNRGRPWKARASSGRLRAPSTR
jgi:two-component system, OmpR family, sensor kinase